MSVENRALDRPTRQLVLRSRGSPERSRIADGPAGEKNNAVEHRIKYIQSESNLGHGRWLEHPCRGPGQIACADDINQNF